jgi:hypothetical protein
MTDVDSSLSQAIKQLTFYWNSINETTQKYFEQLYEEMPEKVSAVLAGAPLPREGDHLTLDAWVTTKPGGGFDNAAVSVSEVVVDPAIPAPGTRFTIRWSGSTDADVPARKDRVRIVSQRDPDKAVADQTFEHAPRSKGSGQWEASFDAGLPTGSYAVQLWVNLEGTDGSFINEHGIMTYGSAELNVGETRESQIQQDMPKLTEAQAAVMSATYEPAFNERVREQLTQAAEALAGMDQLADGFKQELRTTADRLRMTPGIEEGDWPALRDRLTGASSRSNIENVGDFALAVIDVVEEVYG